MAVDTRLAVDTPRTGWRCDACDKNATSAGKTLPSGWLALDSENFCLLVFCPEHKVPVLELVDIRRQAHAKTAEAADLLMVLQRCGSRSKAGMMMRLLWGDLPDIRLFSGHDEVPIPDP